MFWKRRKTEEPLFVLEPDDRRLYFRATPHATHPAEMIIDNHPVTIVDIGAGGVGFINVKFEKDMKLKVVIKLNGYRFEIFTDVTIINTDINDICHCYFNKILERDVDALHKYVLEIQKIEIKEKKKFSKASTTTL